MIWFAAAAICGWFVITRGEWHMSPDGEWKKYGMIFRDWSLFWEQYRDTKKIYYIGRPLTDKYLLVSKIRPDLIPGKYCIDMLEHEGYFKSPLDKFHVEERDLDALKALLLVEIEWDVNKKRFRFYQDEPVYTFPSWLRKPLSECPPCMASVYGSVFYWFVVIQVHTLFSWSSKEFLAKLGFWVIFCLILACANKFIDQKMKL